MKRYVIAMAVLISTILFSFKSFAGEGSEDTLFIDSVYMQEQIIDSGEQQVVILHVLNAPNIERAVLSCYYRDKDITKKIDAFYIQEDMLVFVIDSESEEGTVELTSVKLSINKTDYLYDFTTSDEGKLSYFIEGNNSDMVAVVPEGASSVRMYSTEEPIQMALDSAFSEVGMNFDSRTLQGKWNNEELVIVLDPGHDPVCNDRAWVNGVWEPQLNWKIATAMKEELEKYSNVKVYINRFWNECPGYTDYGSKAEKYCLDARVDRAANYKADLYISIHNNAAGNGTLQNSANGAMIFVSNYSKYTSDSKTLANNMLNLLGKLGLKNNGAKVQTWNGGTYDDGSVWDYYGVIRRSVLKGFPGILIEHAFMDSPKDLSYLTSDAKLEAMGVADAQAVVNYFGLIPREEQEIVGTKIDYRTHVQTYGWQNYVSEGEISGTVGQSKRLEGINIILRSSEYEGDIEYQTHVQTYGWQDWKSSGMLAGTTGESKRLEAIKIRLTGDIANVYDVYYRVHVQKLGWLDWAKNGESAGSAGYSYRLEGIQIRLVKKGDSVPEPTGTPFVQRYLKYQTHVQTYGWEDMKYDNDISGTVGMSKRLEAIKISLYNQPYSGGIEYKTHVQTYGWQNWVSNGQEAGTTGQSKRLEAIQIRLTGEMADMFDIYYRVHVQQLGWLGWAQNGESAGSAGYSYRLEGIQIVLLPKGSNAPGMIGNAFIEKTEVNETESVLDTQQTATFELQPQLEDDYQETTESRGPELDTEQTEQSELIILETYPSENMESSESFD